MATNNRTAKIELLGGEGDPSRLNGLVAEIGGQRPDVIIAITSPAAVALKNAKLSFGNRKKVAGLALKHRLPTIHSFPPEVQDGGLMFYGPSNEENYQRTAALADRILKGARPSELPVEQPTKYELIVNLKTAKAIGLAIPESFLLRADEVIE